MGRLTKEQIARHANTEAVRRLRARRAVEAAKTAETALLDRVPDPEQKLPFREWQNLSPELYQLQLDYVDCQELNLPLYIAGETPEDRTARIKEAMQDGIIQQSTACLKDWEKEFETILEKNPDITHKRLIELFDIWEEEYEAQPQPKQNEELVSDCELPVVPPDQVGTLRRSALERFNNTSGSLSPEQIIAKEHEKEMEQARLNLLRHNLLNGEEL